MQKQQEKDILKGKEGKKRPANRDDDTIGPISRKLKKVDLQDLILDNLPSSDSYQLSLMHRQTLHMVLCAPKTDLIITLSVDGHIKFWRKVFHLIQFAKNYKAHGGLITGASLSKNQDLLCSVGLDKTLKVFDLLNCDLKLSIRLNFAPICCQFIPQDGKDWQVVAVGEQKTGKIWIVDTQLNQTHDKIQADEEIIVPTKTIQKQQEEKEEQTLYTSKAVYFHKHPIRFIKMNWDLNVCVSIDERAFVEVWDPNTLDFPTHLPYKYKTQTQFLTLLQANSSPLSLSLSPKGTYLSVMLKDKIIRIFSMKTGKLIHTISQNIKDIIKIQQDPLHPDHLEFVLDQHQYQKKLHIEKDLQMAKDTLFNPNVQFDQTEQLVIYGSFHGIKVYSLKNRMIQKVIGRKENQRFIRVVAYQGRQMRNPNGNANIYGQRKAIDPLIIATAFRRSRFYMFSRRIPQIEGQNAVIRDVVNQRQTKEEAMTISQPKMVEKQNQVVLQTTKGDIHLLLYLEDCPKTCQNFIKLTKKGYYNGIIFHRVIKGFMNQSGCPKGDGTGGESVWGGTFEDELRPEKYLFDRPYVLAMANKGPNTNGSQFFTTVIACPWLNNKHTIFGRVIKGIEAVCDINKLKTDKGEKPLEAVKILSAKVI